MFLATLVLYIFGGGVINDFAFMFMVGVVTGTYSSIYIASALVLWWNKGQRPDIGGNTMAVGATEPTAAETEVPVLRESTALLTVAAAEAVQAAVPQPPVVLAVPVE